jgi:eukaryotic-like serine/threonine-protein kinase
MSLSGVPFKNVGEFRLDELIQESPYTLSIKGFQPGLNRPVFIKLLKPQTQQQKQWLERFHREARISAKLKHPHIVDVYTLGEHEGYAYMAMSFVDGLSLAELLKEKESLSTSQSCLIYEQILPALQLGHDEGIVHRDVKPGNILIDRKGLARITDFGLAHLDQDVAMTQQGAILGTPAYMAPEQVTGEYISPATDIFSLGATFYEMLTGIKPFGGENYSECLQKIINWDPPPPSQVRPGVSTEIDDLIQAMLQKNPKERPETTLDVLAKIKTVIPENDEKKERSELAKMVSLLKPAESFSTKKRINMSSTVKGPVSKPKKLWQKLWIILLGLLLIVILLALIYPLKRKSHYTSKLKDKPEEHITDIERPQLEGENKMAKAFSERDTLKTRQNPVLESSVKLAQMPLEQSAVPIKKQEESIQLKGQNSSLAGQGESGPVVPKTAPAHVQLSIEPWANIRLDGQTLDSIINNIELELAAGEHEIVLSHPEFAPYILELSLSTGEERKVDFSFLQQAGFLDIQVRPWAEIYLDDKHIDNTPLNRLLVCPAGERRLELRNPNFETYRQVLNVQKGDTLKIFHVMK